MVGVLKLSEFVASSTCDLIDNLCVFFCVHRVERSSDQVIKPVNLEALSKWVGHIPEDVVRDMADIAPMLSVLGYDPYANPPDYGKADSWVKDNTLRVCSQFHIEQLQRQNTEQPFVSINRSSELFPIAG